MIYFKKENIREANILYHLIGTTFYIRSYNSIKKKIINFKRVLNSLIYFKKENIREANILYHSIGTTFYIQSYNSIKKKIQSHFAIKLGIKIVVLLIFYIPWEHYLPFGVKL